MTYTPQEIMRLRDNNPAMRDRDFATTIGISEAELVAALCHLDGAQRLVVDMERLLDHAQKLGEVMTLTRNDHAVHETIGQFESVFSGGGDIALTLGQIDLRIFKKHWCYGFCRDIEIAGVKRQGIQIFDDKGDAVFKLYARETTDMQAWQAMIDDLLHEDQTGILNLKASKAVYGEAAPEKGQAHDLEGFKEKWRNMRDVHELHNILKAHNLSRHDAMLHVDAQYAQPLAHDTVHSLLEQAQQAKVPIMCFIGNHGCIQIFTGPISTIKIVGDWLNILDEKFHMHLLQSAIDQVWLVRKPTKDGIVSSMEVFDSEGNFIVQFFGQRGEGNPEREDWRHILECQLHPKQLAYS